MEIKGLTAANLQSLANVLEISVSKLLQAMVLRFIDTLTVEQSIKLSGCESEEEAERVFKEVITPMLEGRDISKKFRLWYDEKTNVWVVDSVKSKDIYHPFVGRYDFATNLFTKVVEVGIDYGVKPEEILLVD